MFLAKFRHRSLRRSVAALGVASLLYLPALAAACTTLSLQDSNGAVVNVMNMEFPSNLGYTVNHIPAGITFQGEDFNGLPQAKWRSEHRVIGTGGKSDPQAIGAGINDKGLYVTSLYLADKTRYQAVGKSDAGQFIAPQLLSTFLLTQYDSVEAVKQALQTIKVAAVPASGFYNVVPTFHWMVTDKNYQSAVIEYTNGELKFYDNPHHALTNAPTFDYHLENIRNYAFLSNQGLTGNSTDTGVGVGTLGMPGDYSPTGRFIRAAFFAKHGMSGDAGIMKQAVEMSNALIYPAGIANYQSAISGEPSSQKTMYAFIANAQSGEVLFRRYGDINWQQYRWSDFDNQNQVTQRAVFDGWSAQ
jgi:choloylglycine hydrolase